MAYLKLGAQRLGAYLSEVQMPFELPNADRSSGVGAVFGIQSQRTGEHLAVYVRFYTGV